MLTYLIEISAYDTTAAALTTLRFSSQPYLHPSAPGAYDNRIRDLPTFRRDIFGKNTTGGAGAVSQGDLTIANPDGELDNLRDFGLAGQACTILLGEDEEPYASFVPFIVGRVEQALFDLNEVRVKLKDRLQDLQQPVQANKYPGDNVLPDGLGGLDDLKGKPLPIAAGTVPSNVTPPCVNTTRLEYQINDGPVLDVPKVRDAGAVLGQQADYTSRADMEANEPTPGFYRVWKAGGYFRLGRSPIGTVTADIIQAPNAASSTAAQVAKALVTRPGGIPVSDIVDGDFVALDAANHAVLGIWIDAESTFAAPLDLIFGSVGAWYGFDAVGKFRVRRVEAPSTPVTTLRMFGLGTDAQTGDLDIVDIRFLSTNDPDKGVPTFRVSLAWMHNYTVMSGTSLVGSVADDARAYFAIENRTVVATDLTVQTPNPLAVQKEVTTLLVNQADAQAEADRVLALYKVRRDFIEVDTPLAPEALQALELGQTVSVVIPRFGYDGGRPMIITGMEYNSVRNILILALWG
jgi:hypothetical protein